MVKMLDESSTEIISPISLGFTPVEWVVEEYKDVWMDKVIVAVGKICFDNIKNGKYNMSSENTKNKNYIIFALLDWSHHPHLTNSHV